MGRFRHRRRHASGRRARVARDPNPCTSSRRTASAGRAALDAKRIAEELGALAVRDIGQPMPRVDEAVERAAAPAERRDPQSQVEVRAEPAPDVTSRICGLTVDEEAPVLGFLAGLVLRPREGVRPQQAGADLEAPGRHGLRGESRQGEPWLSQQMPVADLRGTPRSGLQSGWVTGRLSRGGRARGDEEDG